MGVPPKNVSTGNMMISFGFGNTLFYLVGQNYVCSWGFGYIRARLAAIGAGNLQHQNAWFQKHNECWTLLNSPKSITSLSSFGRKNTLWHCVLSSTQGVCSWLAAHCMIWSGCDPRPIVASQMPPIPIFQVLDLSPVRIPMNHSSCHMSALLQSSYLKNAMLGCTTILLWFTWLWCLEIMGAPHKKNNPMAKFPYENAMIVVTIHAMAHSRWLFCLWRQVQWPPGMEALKSPNICSWSSSSRLIIITRYFLVVYNIAHFQTHPHKLPIWDHQRWRHWT